MAQQGVTRFLLSADEVAQSLSISRMSVYRLLKRGELTSVKIGGLRRIKITALQAYVDKLEGKQHGEAR